VPTVASKASRLGMQASSSLSNGNAKRKVNPLSLQFWELAKVA